MIGFGNFGGQRNTSFPMRQNPPQERAVNDPFAGMGGAGGWESDWQNRFNEEASRARAATPGSAGTMVARPQTFDSAGYLAANPDVGVQSNWQPEVGAAVFGAGSGVDPAALHLAHWGASEGRGGSNFNEAQYLQLNPDVAAAVSSGQFSSGLDHFGMHGRSEGRNVAQTFDYVGGSAGDPGYTPDFTALNAEKDRMKPLAENQIRQQQAFDMMNGWGQQNAVMGPEYTQAGFGQVTGETNIAAPAMGQAAFDLSGGNEGISTDWLTGVYNPQQGQSVGVYRPLQGGGMGGWGL
jgi:hypothetical protein